MENKNLKLVITLILSVVIISIFVILRQRQIAKEPGKIEVYSGAAVKGQLNSTLAVQCLANAYNEYKDLWNQACEEKNLEDKCGLPMEFTDELKEKYRKVQDGCAEQYPY